MYAASVSQTKENLKIIFKIIFDVLISEEEEFVS